MISPVYLEATRRFRRVGLESHLCIQRHTGLANRIEDRVERQLSSLASRRLLQSTASKYITYTLIVAFVVCFCTRHCIGRALQGFDTTLGDLRSARALCACLCATQVHSITQKQTCKNCKRILHGAYMHKHWWNRSVAASSHHYYHITSSLDPEDFENNERPESGLTVGASSVKIVITRTKTPPLKQAAKKLSRGMVIFNHTTTNS